MSKFLNSNKSLLNIQKRLFSFKIPDYIIIGGGSAGCVLAGRLSENSNTNVLLLEAGPSDRGRYDSWKIHMPAALTYNISDERYNWNYTTEPQEKLKNKKLVWPRGRVLGGSSSLNAMCYVRGHALDYDKWATVAKGWDYKYCLPYFKKAQSHELGEDEYRGGNGPLYVTRCNTKNKLFENYINAGIECGYPYTQDMNGYQQEGFGPMDCTVYSGKRWSTSSAYIYPNRNRKNLEVMTNTFTNKIIFSGKRAIGVELENGEKIFCDKEVILSCGAINSPQLLMLSGIGDADELIKFKINMIHDLPTVGKNLQDHVEVYLQYECKNPITLKDYINWFPNPTKRIFAGLDWFLFKKGLCSYNHFESGSFLRSRAGIEHPDVQHHFFPGAVESQKDIINVHAYQIHCGTMRPKSRGYIKLKSNNPRDKPIIQPNIYDVKEDLDDMCNAVILTMEILNAKAFESDRHKSINFDEKMKYDRILLEDWIKTHTESAYHCSGTCAMGSVTDEEGRVKGLEGLRVVDASIMPYVPSGNTNAPTIMIAEKIADAIKGIKLEPSKAHYYIANEWMYKQR